MPFDATDSATTDEALLALYARGDRGAAQELARRLTPRVLAHAFRMLRDRAEAEDIAQEAMLRLWKVAPQWEAGRAQVTTWLYRVVANLCTDRLRQTRRNADIEDAPEQVDQDPVGEQRLVNEERKTALQNALQKLPDRQRQAVILRHLEGLQNPEIAQVMDISVEAVESLTARGKKALKAALAPRKEELGIADG